MKRVLIVRLDAIGDYILWRNCLQFLRRSARYRDARLTMFGNPAWRNLAETFDADCADEWLWADNRDSLFRRGYENILPSFIWHRRVSAAQTREKRRLAARGFDEVLVPCAFPDALLDEFVAGLAPTTIGVVNGETARTKIYTHLVDAGTSPFVFLRNRAIASAMTGETCAVPFELKRPDVPQTNDILFFNGASHWTRRWPHRRWRELAARLPSGFRATEVPKGGSLADFVRLAASCAAVVSNDTMALHAAAALGLPAVGIVNGVSGRGAFWPYPDEMGRHVSICAPAKVPRIPIPLLGPRLAQYLALSSVAAPDVAKALAGLTSGLAEHSSAIKSGEAIKSGAVVKSGEVL